MGSKTSLLACAPRFAADASLDSRHLRGIGMMQRRAVLLKHVGMVVLYRAWHGMYGIVGHGILWHVMARNKVYLASPLPSSSLPSSPLVA